MPHWLALALVGAGPGSLPERGSGSGMVLVSAIHPVRAVSFNIIQQSNLASITQDVVLVQELYSVAHVKWVITCIWIWDI